MIQELKTKTNTSGTTTLIIPNEEMNGIIKIVQTLEDSNILLKGVTKTIKNETRKYRGEFLGTLVVTSGSILLANVLSGKGIAKAGYGNKNDKGIVRAGYGKEWYF